jgi:hypothetical protein
LNKKFLSYLAQKALDLQKAFENKQDRPCPAFISDRRCAARF